MTKKTDFKTKLCVFYATGFRTGYSPFAPGTVGTLIAIPLVIILNAVAYPWLYISLTIFIFFTGVYASTIAENYFQRKDPGHVNIDEIAAYLAFMFFLPADLKTLLIGFFVFRIMDIIKLPPTPFFEKIDKGWGIMLDDLIAAIYTYIIMFIITYLI